jgi:hypothetical protein
VAIKYDEGDEVRLKHAMLIGPIHIRTNTIGTVKKVKKKFGGSDVVVRFRGVDFDVTIKGGKDIAPNGDKSYD